MEGSAGVEVGDRVAIACGSSEVHRGGPGVPKDAGSGSGGSGGYGDICEGGGREFSLADNV